MDDMRIGNHIQAVTDRKAGTHENNRRATCFLERANADDGRLDDFYCVNKVAAPRRIGEKTCQAKKRHTLDVRGQC